MTVDIIHGDCMDVMQFFASNSFDSCVTDPPYNLESIKKRFGAEGAAAARTKQTGVYARQSKGFMGKTWDSDVAFRPEMWAEVYRVLKPGAHVVAFGGSRTYHRLASAIEDAGFEIRDQIMWLYGSGFPKSHNLDGDWSGWGTALKPAHEPIVLARKPLVGTVAANVAAWGCGAINVDGCRVGDEVRHASFTSLAPCHGNQLGRPGTAEARRGTQGAPKEYVGRFPANVIHDGSDEVLAAFPNAPGQIADASSSSESRKTQNVYGAMRRGSDAGGKRADSGSAARFFYCAKASKSDRDDGLAGFTTKAIGTLNMRSDGHAEKTGALPQPRANTHPTVKPTDLMRYLCRMVTPPGGHVLDPFLGSGSTGRGAVLEGFDFTGIELTEEYVPIARARIAAVQGVFG